MKKLIIGVLMAASIIGACTGCGLTQEHVKYTLSGPGENEKYIYEYVDGEFQSITAVKYVVLQETEAE